MFRISAIILGMAISFVPAGLLTILLFGLGCPDCPSYYASIAFGVFMMIFTSFVYLVVTKISDITEPKEMIINEKIEKLALPKNRAEKVLIDLLKDDIPIELESLAKHSGIKKSELLAEAKVLEDLDVVSISKSGIVKIKTEK